MDEQEFFSRAEIRLKEKQAKCLHRAKSGSCSCPSFVCLLCGVHIDNMKTAQREKIKELQEIVCAFELLTGVNKEEVLSTITEGVFL